MNVGVKEIEKGMDGVMREGEVIEVTVGGRDEGNNKKRRVGKKGVFFIVF